MYRVLIGVLAILLFCLAIAGQQFLVGKFKNVNYKARATILADTMLEAARGAARYQGETGRTIMATTTNANGAFLVPRFLKTAPFNTYTGSPVSLTDAGGSTSVGTRAVMWSTNIGTDDDAKAICRSIEQRAGASDPEASQSIANVDAAGGWQAWTSANKRLGCLVNKASRPAHYQAYVWF